MADPPDPPPAKEADPAATPPTSDSELSGCEFPESSPYNWAKRQEGKKTPPCWVCRDPNKLDVHDTQLNLCVCFKCREPGLKVVPVCENCLDNHTKTEDGLPFQGSWRAWEYD